MTNREKILLKILLVIIVLTVFYFPITNIKDSINHEKENIIKYEQAISKINNNKHSQEEDKETKKFNNENKDLSEIVLLLLEDFNNNGIVPERYQLNDKDNNQYVEFTIDCNTYNFAKFILNSTNTYYPYTLISCSIKSEHDNIKGTLRYSNDECYIQEYNKYSSIKPINSLFYKTSKAISNEVTVILENKEELEDGSTIYKSIGIIQEDSIKYLYIKNIETSRILKIKLENIIDTDSDYYIINIDQKRYRIKK